MKKLLLKVWNRITEDKTKTSIFVLTFFLGVLFGVMHVDVIKEFFNEHLKDYVPLEWQKTIPGVAAFTSFLFGILRNGSKKQQKDLEAIKKEVRILSKNVKKAQNKGRPHHGTNEKTASKTVVKEAATVRPAEFSKASA